MPSRSRRRRTLVLLLAATLAASWTSAAGPQARTIPKAAAPAHQDLLSRAWSFLTSLWGETGCTGDPDGRCVTKRVQVAPPHLDTGCDVDPNGRCTP